mmetsp:Transcript_9699/g.28649  ORF Transcript_9699/g.28649 Transcript_9699/m.28649 type:complete len:88 (+) Transcript_9699:105-368(+)
MSPASSSTGAAGLAEPDWDPLEDGDRVFAGTAKSGNPALTKEQVEQIKQDKWLTISKQVDECTKWTFTDQLVSVLACACFDRRSLRP